MARNRSELVIGLTLLAIFSGVMISSEILFPYAIGQSEYELVRIEDILENPMQFEGENISTQVAVSSVIGNGTYIVMKNDVSITLIVPLSLGLLNVNEVVCIRGISWIHTNNSIVVRQFYVFDSSSSLIRSVPGIIIFSVLFFSVFTIDIHQLAFVRRK